MIKISKHTLPSRILSIVIGLFPALIVSSYAYSQRDEITSLLLSILIMAILILLNVYLNSFDYVVLFDCDSKEFIFRRFGKEWRFEGYKSFEVKSYPMFISFGFQYYKFQIDDKGFRFRYSYEPKGIKFFINSTKITKDIKDDILNQINCNLNK